MISTKLLIFSAVFLFLYVLWTRRRFYLLMLKIPGTWGLPLIGTALQVRKREEFLEIFRDGEEKWSNHYFLSWLGIKPFLIVAEPQIAQELLSSPLCINRTIVADPLEELTGFGLFTANEPIWSRHRKYLNPAFNNKILTSFLPVFNEESQQLVSLLNSYCGGDDIDISEIMKITLFRLTTRTLMDRDITDEKSSSDKHLTESNDYAMAYVMDAMLSPWIKSEWIQKVFRLYPQKKEALSSIEDYIIELINKKISSKKKPQPELPNFINIALKLMDRGDFTFRNVINESRVIVLAGFETTNNSIAYTLVVLAMFPEYQEKLFEELQSFYPDKNDFEVTVTDIQNLVYLDMVVNEILRLMAPVPVVFRELSDDFELSNGLKLPKGLQIGIDIFNMQRRKDIWGPEAHKFNPYNFLPSNLEDKHPFAFTPFAKGVRSCIGWRYALLSMKVMLVKLLRNYKFETDFKFEDLVFVEDISLKLKISPKVRITRRHV